MFDAKSLLEMMMRGGAPQAPQSPQGAAGTGGLADLLGKMLGGAQAGPSAQANPSGDARSGQGGGMLGIEELLRQAQQQLGGAQNPRAAKESPQGQTAAGEGGLFDVLGKVLGQATSGVKEGARKVDDATGASGHIGGAVKGATGQSPDEIMAQVKDWIAKNQLGAGIAAGGLGAVLLGTKTGRSAAATAAKIGGLALIGGLAYKAYQNHQAGRPLISGADQSISPAPNGSGYETDAASNDDAVRYIRAMIAAAASDGRLDATEYKRIMGSLSEAGAGDEAEVFLSNELNNPASTAELARGVRSSEEAIQVYTAARLAIEVDTQAEHAFLADLAAKLGIEPALARHIDAAVTATS